MKHHLLVNEIFASVDGEVNYWGQGCPTVFVRLQGCNLACPYCDTKQSIPKVGGQIMSVDEVLQKVASFGLNKVTITGGEPLLQAESLYELCFKLKNLLRQNISIETNGTLPIPSAMNYMLVSWVFDYKIRVNEQEVDSYLSLFECARGALDIWIKLLVKDEQDFEYAAMLISEMQSKSERLLKFAVSPVYGEVSGEQLFFWMMKYKNMFRNKQLPYINVQIHKIIFPNGEKNLNIC